MAEEHTADYGARFEALTAALEATRDMDYDPSSEGWICGDHGIQECDQGDCASLVWPEPNTFPTSDFASWAHEQFLRAVEPYDLGEIPEMPEEAFTAHSLHEWPVGDALEAVRTTPFSPGVQP